MVVAAARVPLPRRLHLELTNRCNSDCTTCIRTHAPDPDCDTPLALVERIVATLPQLESVALQVNGETLLYPDLPALLDLLVRRGVRAELNTNALALDGPRAELLLGGRLAQLNVSLDGAVPATYQRLRGVDALERVVANTERFLRRRGPVPAPRVGLWMTCTRHNLGELPALVELAGRIGADEVYLQRLVYFGALEATADASLHGRLTDEHRAVLRDARARAERLGVALRACGGHDPEQMFDPDVESWQQCRRPTESAVVMADGDVVPCCISTFVAPREAIRMGNLADQSWDAIWNGPRYAAFRDERARGEGPDFCRGCGRCWSL